MYSRFPLYRDSFVYDSVDAADANADADADADAVADDDYRHYCLSGQEKP